MPLSQLPESFRAFRVEIADGEVRRGPKEVAASTLPLGGPSAEGAGLVTIEVAYSSLNYKDALSASGNRGVTRTYPHTPGIDAAGTVLESGDPRFQAGDEVVCTGFDLGMDTPGGWGEYVRVPADWLVRLPPALDLRSAMALGTAGVTAALAVARLESVGVTPALGPMVVTGASGGVGGLAVALLAARGYEVVASSGTPEAHGLLERLGASRIVPREEFGVDSGRPLGKAEFAGGIDAVGGVTLANLLKRTRIGGAVAACGLVGSPELNVGVYPFILRGVSLLGVDSQHWPIERRSELWRRLAADWNDHLAGIDGLVEEVRLEDLEDRIVAILEGRVSGRVVVAVDPHDRPV